MHVCASTIATLRWLRSAAVAGAKRSRALDGRQRSARGFPATAWSA